MLIVIHFNPSCLFLYIRGLQTTARETIHPACEAILQTTVRGPNPAREYILQIMKNCLMKNFYIW